MKITEFGKVVRKARLDAGVSLLEMANELNVSSAFLSGMETGRKKVTKEWVSKIDGFFSEKNVDVSQLPVAADVSNKTVSLDGLSPAHQMLVAGFARTSLSHVEMENLKTLLTAANAKKEAK